MTWVQLPRSARLTVGRFTCDVWPVGEGARYTVMDTVSGAYVKGGKCIDLEWAMQVSAQFARSLSELGENA